MRTVKFVSSSNKAMEERFKDKMMLAVSQSDMSIKFLATDGSNDGFKTSKIVNTRRVDNYIVYATQNSTYTFELYA